MKPTPKDWPRLSASLFYDDAAAAIDWLVRAFGFEVRLKVDGPDGAIMHSELTYGEGLIMVASAAQERRMISPRQAGGATQGLFLYVDDVEAHEARARAAGADVTRGLAETDYGPAWHVDRVYGCADLEGHLWHFAQRIREAAKP